MVLFLSILKSYEKIGLYSLFSNIVLPLTQLISITLFIYFGIGVSSVTYSYLIGFFITSIATFVACKKKIPELFKKNKIVKNKYPGLFKEVLSYSLPLFMAGVTWKIFSWGDSFVIGYFKTASDVGIYNAAVPIAMLLTISSQMFMQLFFPLITKVYFKGDKETVKQVSQQVGKWIFAINIPLAILLFMFPERFIELLFGKDFISAGNALKYLAIGFFMLSFFDISSKLISMKGKTKVILFDVLIMALFNVTLNIILIPKYGINGAAVATSISFVILSVVITLQSKQYVSIVPIRRKMFNILVASIISTIILYYLRLFVDATILSFVILSLVFSLVYLILIFVLKGFDKNDFFVIRKLIGKNN
jgi:O-antigen/teichoic acid export membrane protein